MHRAPLTVRGNAVCTRTHLLPSDGSNKPRASAARRVDHAARASAYAEERGLGAPCPVGGVHAPFAAFGVHVGARAEQPCDDRAFGIVRRPRNQRRQSTPAHGRASGGGEPRSVVSSHGHTQPIPDPWRGPTGVHWAAPKRSGRLKRVLGGSGHLGIPPAPSRQAQGKNGEREKAAAKTSGCTIEGADSPRMVGRALPVFEGEARRLGKLARSCRSACNKDGI